MKKRKLVTSALPYVNNVPHLGNLIQVLSADVFARFCRLKEEETLYICGTDEYGTATETRAALENKSPRELCDYYHRIHAEVYDWFNIAFDYFGRTSTLQQTEITQGIFLDLEKNGFITEHEIEQLYCPSCARFLADRYVAGVCPACSGDARGDQCEHCGKLLEPTELKEPKCSVCSAKPELRSTKHLYINLPAIIPQYEAWMSEASKQGQWSNNAVQVTRGWLRDGLQERAVTRDLKWGIPVPKKGFEKKVFYVWFDAPIGYISITKCWADKNGKNWKDWWLGQKDVQLFQFIGKDNIAFHTVIFPCSLIGSGKDWTKLFHVSSTEYLNYESGKFSKSKGVGVFGTDAMESGIPADIWRFYIFYNRPEKNDYQFTWKDFQERVNSELIGNLCNLVNRTVTFVSKYYGGIIPEAEKTGCGRADIKEMVKHLRTAAAETAEKIAKLSDKAGLREAFREIFTLSAAGNKAFQDGEPWHTRESDPAYAAALIKELCYLIKDILIMIHPYMPSYADEAGAFLGIKIWSGNVFKEDEAQKPKPENCLAWKNIGEREGLKKIENTKIIFKTLDSKQIDIYRMRYSGKQKESPCNAGTQKNCGQEKHEEPKPQNLNPAEIFLENIVLKTAKILSVEKHPDADKLYIEKIDDGSGIERTIISGLVPFFKPEELEGKSIIIADNLKPRKMRGVLSQGMLLAASSEDGEKTVLELLSVPEAKPGTVLTLEGESVCSSALEKQIDADTFFSVPIEIKDFTAYAAGKKLFADSKEIKTSKIRTGTAG